MDGADGDFSASAASSVENDIPYYDGTGVIPKSINAESYADYAAWEHSGLDGGEAYLNWLADFCVNVAGPQTAEKLLSVPCFAEAANQGLISKYMAFQLDHNDQNQYGAMTMFTFLEKKAILPRMAISRFII